MQADLMAQFQTLAQKHKTWIIAGEVAAFGDPACEILSLWQQARRRHVHEGSFGAV